MIKWFKKLFNKNKMTPRELYKKFKQYNKGDLIKEIIVQSQLINKNQCGVPHEFKKSLRLCPKKHLIKTLILLKLQRSYRYKRLEKRHKKLLKSRKVNYANT